MPSGMPPGSIDLTAPMSDEQLLHLGQRMLADQGLARSIGQDYPGVYKRVRENSCAGSCDPRARRGPSVNCICCGMPCRSARVEDRRRILVASGLALSAGRRYASWHSETGLFQTCGNRSSHVGLLRVQDARWVA